MKERHEEIIRFFKANALTISLQVVGIIIVLLNLWLATKLSPLAEDVQLIKSRVQAIESTQSTLVRKDEFTQVITRLDKMSDRLDAFIAIHIK